MTHYYIGLIHKDENSDYGVSFPDLPGCVTAGTTLDEARLMAEEALSFHLEGIQLDGDVVPQPSSLTEVMSDLDNRDGVAIMIPVQVFGGDHVRFDCEVPTTIAAKIDAFAEQHGLDRTSFFLRAATHELETN